MSFNFRARAEPLAFGYHDHATLSIRMTKFIREAFGGEKEDAEEFFKVLKS